MREGLQSQRQAEPLHKELHCRYLNDCIVPSSFITALCAWLQPTQKAHGAGPAFQASLTACAAQVLTAARDTCHGTGLLQQGQSGWKVGKSCMSRTAAAFPPLSNQDSVRKCP